MYDLQCGVLLPVPDDGVQGGLKDLRFCQATGNPTLRATSFPVWLSRTSQTVEKWPHPSFLSTVYRPLAKVSPSCTGW
jgi:hypothetical protein